MCSFNFKVAGQGNNRKLFSHHPTSKKHISDPGVFCLLFLSDQCSSSREKCKPYKGTGQSSSTCALTQLQTCIALYLPEYSTQIHTLNPLIIACFE